MIHADMNTLFFTRFNFPQDQNLSEGKKNWR